MKKHSAIILIFLFLISRVYIWISRPIEFTEIIYSYMPYAHLWAQGTRPYLDQLYEYPPATIPLFYLPHVIDMRTLYSSLHINYLNAYRGLLLLIDIALFSTIWKTLKKQKKPWKLFMISLLYYIVATAKAHHFLYDTMDWAFVSAITFGISAPVLFQSSSLKTFFSWFGYALGIALKYINAPLGLLYALLEKKSWKRTLILGGTALLLVWIIPLTLFRSSLSVSFVYHKLRGLQIDTFGAVISRTFDSFTHSEEIINIYKNFELTGPISNRVLSIINVVFPVSITLYLLYSFSIILKASVKQYHNLRIQLTTGYIFLFMITAKVLSLPFNLWHIPLLSIFPYKNLRQQLSCIIPSLMIIIVTLSSIPTLQIGPFTTEIYVGWIRSLLYVYLFIQTIKSINAVTASSQS